MLKSHLGGCGEEEFDRISRVGVLCKLTAGFLPKLDSARTRAKVKACLRKDSETHGLEFRQGESVSPQTLVTQRQPSPSFCCEPASASQ